MVAANRQSVFLPYDGPARWVKPKGEFWTLAEWYELIGCDYVEHIGVDKDYILLFDENGKYKDLPANKQATVFGRKAGIMPDDYIAGHALLILRSEME